MELHQQYQTSKIPAVGGGSRFGSSLPRPTSFHNEHQVWRGWIGRPVSVSGVKCGTLLFYGKTQFAEGFFCGVALDEPEGKHDGSVNGVRYFTCRPNHGVFAPATKVLRMSPPKSNLTFTRIESLSSPPLNVSFTVGPAKEARINRTFEKNRDATFDLGSSPSLQQQKHDATFCVEDSRDDQHMMCDIADDEDVEESSLGILTASQMVDLSMFCCDIPKTQSCDDINELPEDEVVENVSVEYLGCNKDVDQSMDSVPTSTPILHSSRVAEDFQVFRKMLERSTAREDSFTLMACPNCYEDVSLLEAQSLSCSFDDVTIHDTSDVPVNSDENSSSAANTTLMSNTINCEQNSEESETTKVCGGGGKSEITTQQLELMNETIRCKLASGELTDLDRVGRMSIEAVMEAMQRQETTTKNRPASTYTVGSTDTGYQGDGECDGHSETAGSPCEEVKPVSVCSQEEMTDTDRMLKSGHMSDSDFFTDQGAISEMELDGEMKQSTSSMLSEPGGGRTGDIMIMFDELAIPEALSIADEEKYNSSSAEGDQTVVEDSKNVDDQLEKTFTEQDVVSPSLKDEEETSNAKGVPKSNRAKTETKKISATTSKSKTTSLIAQQPIKKVVRSPRKGGRWDAVTSKIAAGMAEEKSKEKREVKSRVNTNLTGARQVIASTKKVDSVTDSLPQGDINSKGSKQELLPDVGIVSDAKYRESKKSLSRPISPVVEIGSSSTSSVYSSLSNPYAPPKNCFVQSKLALPKIILKNERCRTSKATGASSTDSKRSRPAKPSVVVTHSTPSQQQKVVELPSAQALPLRLKNASAASAKQNSNACPPKLVKAPAAASESSHAKIAKHSPRTPVLSSRAAHAKIEDLTAEVRRLGALCEQRTKELNLVKMQLKNTCCGFDAFAIMVNYLVGELDAFSHPKLLADMQKTREQLVSFQKLLGQSESELDLLRKQHSEEVEELGKEMGKAMGQVASLSSQLEETESRCRHEVEDVRTSCTREIREAEERHRDEVEELHSRRRLLAQEMETTHEKVREEDRRSHENLVADLLRRLEELKERSQSLEMQSKQYEETLKRDTNSKIQWMYAKNDKLIAEVDSLKSVMEMKQEEIHSLRKENMEIQKELEELPLAQKEIEKLRARNEDLQAVVREKSNSERKLCYEALQMRDACERIHKDNTRICMEKEELQWKLQQTLDGSWSLCDTEHSRRECTLPSPALSPCIEKTEECALSTSPINYYSSTPLSTASSPGKSPCSTVVFRRQRHSSLGPHRDNLEPEDGRRPVDRSQSLHESELYLKARLQFESDPMFQPPREIDGDSTNGSCEEEDKDTHGVEPCSPRSLGGEAMVASTPSYEGNLKTPQFVPVSVILSDDSDCESE